MALGKKSCSSETGWTFFTYTSKVYFPLCLPLSFLYCFIHSTFFSFFLPSFPPPSLPSPFLPDFLANLFPCHQFSSFAQSCSTLCDPMNCSTPGFPIHHQLPELTQTHAHRISDAIQPFHPLPSPSPPAFNLSHPVSGSFPMSQLFASGGQSIGVSASASVLPMNIQDWFPYKTAN